MKLYYQENIDEIENCPLGNEQKDIDLYRLIKDEDICNKDLEPKAVNPRNKKFQKECIGWGISTYNSLEVAINIYEGMNETLQARFSHIAIVTVNESFGVKYQTGDNKNHYTLFPCVDDNLLSKFKTIQKL